GGVVVGGGQRRRETVARSDVLLDESVCEGPHSGRASDQRQLVRRDESGGGDQVGDELGERVDRRRWAPEAGSSGRRRAPGLGARGAQVRWTLDVHGYPSFEVSAA